VTILQIKWDNLLKVRLKTQSDGVRECFLGGFPGIEYRCSDKNELGEFFITRVEFESEQCEEGKDMKKRKRLG